MTLPSDGSARCSGRTEAVPATALVIVVTASVSGQPVNVGRGLAQPMLSLVVHGGQSSDYGQLHTWNYGTDMAEMWLTINEPLRHLWQTSKLGWSVTGSVRKGRCRHHACCYQLPMGLSDLSGCNSPPPPLAQPGQLHDSCQTPTLGGRRLDRSVGRLFTAMY
jgi:hypothetical protein